MTHEDLKGIFDKPSNTDGGMAFQSPGSGGQASDIDMLRSFAKALIALCNKVEPPILSPSDIGASEKSQPVTHVKFLKETLISHFQEAQMEIRPLHIDNTTIGLGGDAIIIDDWEHLDNNSQPLYSYSLVTRWLPHKLKMREVKRTANELSANVIRYYELLGY